MFPAKFFKNTNFKEKGFSIEIEILAKFLKYNLYVLTIQVLKFCIYLVELDMNALSGSTMVKVFDQMRKLQGFTDKGMPGRDWNVATAMVMKGEAAFQIMGDWAKGEFSNAGMKPGIDFYCLPTPSNHGYLYNVDSFIFYGMKGKSKVNGQKMLASSIMGKNFQKIFNIYKGSIPARLDVPMDEFDMCAKGSASDLNKSGPSRFNMY